MWLEEKCVSTLSHFMSHAKFSTDKMQRLYALQVMHLYKIKNGYFIIDDTMRHHTNYCKWIHGVFVLFDHALKTNLKAVCISKYDLAVKMLEWVINNRFPNCAVLADSWFGIGPFIKELKRLKLGYVVEIKDIYTVRTPCKKPKLTPKGRLAKNQYDLITLPKVFKNILTFTKCGFAADKEKGKEEKTIYHTKIITGRLNSIAGKHRIIQSIDP
ncbi:MAG: hypothetical protein U9N47_06695, partial [Thermodesulfobacteriota bacterium]|nr:hypothetical protein [Thermodesulfobacteriota bacterium]